MTKNNDLAQDAAKKRRDDAFGAVLKAYRERAGLSQEALALDSHLDRSYISLLERGERSPTLNTLYVVALALNTKPTLMVEDWFSKIQAGS